MAVMASQADHGWNANFSRRFKEKLDTSPQIGMPRPRSLPQDSFSSSFSGQEGTRKIRRAISLDPHHLTQENTQAAPAKCSPDISILEILGTTDASVSDLAALFQLQRHYNKKNLQSRHRIYRETVSGALGGRLARAGDLAYKTCIDCYLAEDRRGFSKVHDAFLDIRNSCAGLHAFGSSGLEKDRETPEDTRKGHKSNGPSAFLDALPENTRVGILDFLSKIRNEPDFLASQICNMSTEELSRFYSVDQSLGPVEPVFARMERSRSTGKSNSQAGFPGGFEDALRRLFSLERNQAFSILAFDIFGNLSQDSGERKQRLEIWSTACAQIITRNTSMADQFIRAVLNTWTTFKERPARRRLENYILKVLEDGSLFPDASERVASTGMANDPRSMKDSLAMEDFLDRAVDQYFDLFKGPFRLDPFPSGVLEIARTTMGKLNDARWRTFFQNLVVAKWLFPSFLTNQVVHPEAYGMLNGHHISEYARQRILKEISQRIQKNVWEVTLNWKQPIEVKVHIREQIEKIYALLWEENILDSRPRTSSSSRDEEKESFSFLTLSASDVVSLIEALYPDRPSRATSLIIDTQTSVLASPSPAITGLSSQSSASASSTDYEASSMTSNSGSSFTSATASRGQASDDLAYSMHGLSSRTSVASQDTLQTTRVQPDKEDQYGRYLRSLVSDMRHYLPGEVYSGSLHSCADHWALLRISSDNQKLEFVPSSCAEDNISRHVSSYAGQDISRLVSTIADLFDECNLLEVSTSSERQLARKKSGYSQSANEQSPSKPGGESVSESDMSLLFSTRAHLHHASQSAGLSLEKMLEARILRFQKESNYVASHSNWLALHQIRRLRASETEGDNFINDVTKQIQKILEGQILTDRDFQESFRALEKIWTSTTAGVNTLASTFRSLRDKTWYECDVRNSAAYEETKNIATALRQMGKTKLQNGKPTPSVRSRALPRQSPAALFSRSENQLLNLLAASKEHGGPAKLSDEQSEITSKWITQANIENFCLGEERIHRFCLEIDRCVRKLAGSDLTKAPVLWSSELFQRDKAIFDSGVDKGDLMITGTGAPHIASASEQDSFRKKSYIDFSRTRVDAPYTTFNLARGLRSGPTEQRPYWRADRTSEADRRKPGSLTFDPREHRAADDLITFWSPVQGQSQLQKTSTDQSTAIGLKGARDAKSELQQFVKDLRQTLVGLLLSDLGSSLWTQGSETDAWFSGELCNTCFKSPAIEAPLRGQLSRHTSSSTTVGRDSTDFHHDDSQDAGKREENSKTRKNRSIRMTSEVEEFPYARAFQDLLQEIAVNANPYGKLKAVHELGSLVSSRLQSSSREGSSRDPTLIPEPHTSLHTSDSGSSSRDASVHFLHDLLRDSSVRPRTLFRDLQYVASLVPMTVLEKTDQGKAFWDLGLAALALKQEVCKAMVEVADETVAYHTNNRSWSPTRKELGQDERPDKAQFSMEDAARMWSITAKEGDPVAQRELAIFYLTNPDIVPRVISPFSKPRDVFRAQLMNNSDEDPRRSDPATMCVAYHWMELSAQGGDSLAKEYLRAREEMNSLP